MRQIFYTLFLLFSTGIGAFAQAGLDPTFGNSGTVLTNFGFGSTDDRASSIVIQPDGKIIVAGKSANDGALARYNPDGSLDNSFGTAGMVTFQLNPYLPYTDINDMLLMPDGKILVSGRAFDALNVNSFVIQFLSNGSIDPGFTAPFTSSDYINKTLIGLQSDGKIIRTWVLSGGINTGTYIHRLLSNGTLDATFPDIFENWITNDILVLPNNDFLLAGHKSSKFALAKYSAQGVKQGITDLTEFTEGSSMAIAMGLQADNKIILAGMASVAGNTDFAIARYNPDGALDNSFAGDGKTTTNFGQITAGHAVNIQADGKIIVSGYRQTIPGDTVFASARYLSNGQLDPCYGDGGKLLIDLPASIGTSAALQADGKIVFAGFSKSSGFDFALARYSANALPTNWYLDFDGDGYGDDGILITACPQPISTLMQEDPNCIDMPPLFPCNLKMVHWVSQGGDCNDNDATSYPGAVEICDEQDNDCDGLIDEDLPTTTYYIDADGDGYGGGDGEEFCRSPGPGYKITGGDCDDNNSNIHPGITSAETCDGVDNNCNGLIDEGCSGKPTISISNVTVYESEGIAVLTINLSFITSLQVKINYATLPGTAVSNKKEKDYKSIGNTMLTIPPGTLSTTITVPIYADNKLENNEYFYVVLSKPTNCILGNVTGIVTILDGAPLNSVTSNKAIISELETQEERFNAIVQPNPSTTGFTLNVSGDNDLPVVVHVRNALGQLVQTLRTGSNMLRFGNELKAGFYFVQVQQGNNSKTIKLIKY